MKTFKLAVGSSRWQYWMTATCRCLLFTATCCCLLLLTATSHAQEWTLAKNEDGIKVYTRMPEGSKLEEVRAMVRVKTTLSAFTALLKDVGGYKEWAYNCVEAKMVKAINDTTQCYYSQTDLPWPVSNRDLVFRSSLKQDAATLIIKTNSVCMPYLLPEVEDVVRIKEGRTAWTLTPATGGFVDVDYYVSINPGGTVPVWLINSTIATGPFKTLQNVRALLQGGKYKDAAFTFVKELE